MPGYSATPLPKKLGIKPGFRVRFEHAPADVLEQLRAALADCDQSKRTGELDFAMFFPKSRAELEKHFSSLFKVLAPAGMLWVSWPKRSSGVVSDLNENVVRQIGLGAGFVDVKVCAVTEIWSGLKFVRRVKDRKK